jgi:threonine/homoserine efflux transporter RhtA
MSNRTTTPGSNSRLKTFGGYVAELADQLSMNLGAVLAVILAHHIGLLTIAGLETMSGGLQVIIFIGGWSLARWIRIFIRDRATALERSRRFAHSLRHPSKDKVRNALKSRETRVLAVLSITSALVNLTYIYAVTHVTIGMYAALEIAGLMITVALIEAIAEKAPRAVVFPLVALAGTAAFTEVWNISGSGLGILAGLATGAGLSLRLVLTHKVRNANLVRQSASAISGAVLLLWSAFYGDLTDIPAGLLWVALACGFLTTGFPQVVQLIARRSGLSDNMIGIIGTFGLVSGAALGLVFLGQHVHLIQVPAAAVIICAIVGHALWGNAEKAAATRESWRNARRALHKRHLATIERKEHLVIAMADFARMAVALDEAEVDAAERRTQAEQAGIDLLEQATRTNAERLAEAERVSAELLSEAKRVSAERLAEVERANAQRLARAEDAGAERLTETKAASAEGLTAATRDAERLLTEATEHGAAQVTVAATDLAEATNTLRAVRKSTRKASTE